MKRKLDTRVLGGGSRARVLWKCHENNSALCATLALLQHATKQLTDAKVTLDKPYALTNRDTPARLLFRIAHKALVTGTYIDDDNLQSKMKPWNKRSPGGYTNLSGVMEPLVTDLAMPDNPLCLLVSPVFECGHKNSDGLLHGTGMAFPIGNAIPLRHAYHTMVDILLGALMRPGVKRDLPALAICETCGRAASRAYYQFSKLPAILYIECFHDKNNAISSGASFYDIRVGRATRFELPQHGATYTLGGCHVFLKDAGGFGVILHDWTDGSWTFYIGTRNNGRVVDVDVPIDDYLARENLTIESAWFLRETSDQTEHRNRAHGKEIV